MHLRVRSRSMHPTKQSFYIVRVDGEVRAPAFDMIWRDVETQSGEIDWTGWVDHRHYFLIRRYTKPAQGGDSDLFIEFPELGHQYVYRIISGIGIWYFEFMTVTTTASTLPAMTVEHGFFSELKYLILINNRTYQGLNEMLKFIEGPIADHYWYPKADEIAHEHFDVSIILDMDMTNRGTLCTHSVKVVACRDAKIVDLFDVLCGLGGSDDFYLNKLHWNVKANAMRLGPLRYSKLAARVRRRFLVEAYEASRDTELKLFPLQSPLGQSGLRGWIPCHPNCQGGRQGQQREVDMDRVGSMLRGEDFISPAVQEPKPARARSSSVPQPLRFRLVEIDTLLARRMSNTG